MVARAQKRNWIDFVAVLVVGAAIQPLGLMAGSDIGLASLPTAPDRGGEAFVQLGGGSTRARMALNAAIDAERRGDLDKAATLFQEAQMRAGDLTADERQELNRRLAANVLALKARREAREQIGMAESAFQHGRPGEAATLIKKITANEVYLSPADKQRFQSLCQRMHGQAPAAPTANVNVEAQAHDKLRRARVELSKSDIEGAETLAREADQMHASFGPQEDSPRKILEDAGKAQRDPKALLLAARAALQRSHFDRAEQYARTAEQLSSPFTFMVGDSPSKVLKDIQVARSHAPAPRASTKVAQLSNDLGSKSLAPSLPAADTEKARTLVREGRQALSRGDVVQARKCAEQASTLKAELHWSEDNPARLLEDVTRAAPDKEKTDMKKAVTGVAIKNKDEAMALLKQGREQLAKGELDEANKTAARLRAARHIQWGLFFVDTPDKFQVDVDHARMQHNKEESVALLAEARSRFEKKDYDGAEKLAYEAQTKHGQYSIWDLGDRPNKLLADVQAARQKAHRIELPAPPTKQTEVADLSHGPLAGNSLPQAAGKVTQASFNDPQSSQINEARQILKEARLAVNNGAYVQARLLADRVRDMHIVLNVPGEDTPDSIYRDITRLSQRSQDYAGSATATVANKPSSVSPYPSSALREDAKVKGSGDNLDAKTRACRLMAEARGLQQQNRLLEACAKIDEARRLGVAFRPDEESPNQLYQQMSFLARQRIDSLVHHANETLRYGTQVPATRCQAAEGDLAQARQLAAAFGQDVQPIENAQRAVDQLRTTGNITLVSTPPEPDKQMTPISLEKPGRTPQEVTHSTAGRQGLQPSQLLDQARLELRSGETANARHLAEEAVKLGAGEAGVAVIRSIDAEEVAQNRRRANRVFDDVFQAYRNRDYRRAGLILASLDTKLLDERRQRKLREILNTPEMAPSARGAAIALTGGQEPNTRGMGAPNNSQPELRTPGAYSTAGRAHATDDPSQSLLAQTKAMREIKFQQLRTEGLSVQAQALERFRTGQSEVAVDMLQEYLMRLAEEQLDPSQLALLRRPVDSRLQQFQLLKAQAEMVNNRFDDKSRGVKHDLAKAKNAEQVKQKNIAQLMKQFNELYGQAKYDQAEMVALRVKELDPDNPMATAAVTMAKYHRNHDQYESRKAAKEDLVVEALNDTDNMGDRDALSKGISFTPDKDLRETIRNRKTLEGFPSPRKSAEERNIERKLTMPLSLSFTNAPLQDVIEYIHGDQGINIFVDKPALAEKGITLDSPITIHLDNIALKSGLKLLLNLVHLTYVVADDVLKITTEEQARGKLEQKVYQVTDLVIAVENFGQVGAPPDTDIGMRIISGGPNQASSMANMTGMQGGQPVGMPAGSSMANANGGFASDPSGGNVQITKQRAQTHEDMLIKLITSTIAPRSWADQGGPGTIDFHPLTMALVINQTPDIQDQVQDLLQALRRLIDQEVAVEVKFISIAEDFFERIGVNFNMNILNKSRSALQVQPQLTSGQFAVPGYVNYFAPNNLISGLTPAGTLTNDLNIPITTTTYPQAIPPFGGYPGIPGFGGITMGLAFLSDIQVFLFMEAVQGDIRSNVMQAPKLTLFNGQTANIAVQDFQFFTVGVSVQNGGFGQLIYNPVTTLFPLNITLTMQAVISGDRRFVRLSLTPSLANVVNGEVNLFPVVTPIFPLFDGTATGQPVVFTQFVQQPRLSRVSVQTTVAVPDGGTVLMGGLKRLSEGRNEFGPPVISKIPYLNRLFRNIGYGRSAESLLIMVTPRIIIQAEEEEKQTGYVPPPAIAP